MDAQPGEIGVGRRRAGHHRAGAEAQEHVLAPRLRTHESAAVEQRRTRLEAALRAAQPQLLTVEERVEGPREAVDGVDGIFIGPSDLSASMGLVGQVDDPRVQKALAGAARACAAAGKPAGILASGSARALEYFKYGYDWVASGSDLGLMMAAARAEAKALALR